MNGITVNGMTGGASKSPMPVKIVAVEMSLGDIFRLTFRVVLSLAVISAIAGGVVFLLGAFISACF